MDLSNLPKITKTKKKRLGRGYGSGKGGHTTNRGMKGQKSRSKIPLWFEGGQLPFIRAIPLLRGKGKFKPLKPSPILIHTQQLNNLRSGSKVTVEKLVEEFNLSAQEAKKRGIKILKRGKLEKKLTITDEVAISKGAADAVKAQEGTVK